MPNLAVLREIARHYDLGFIARFEEPGNWLYGEAVFKDGQLYQVTVNSFDEENWYQDPSFIALQELQASMLTQPYPER